MNRPAMWFFPGDWLHDAALRSCSPAARSLWMDMICLMHQSDPYGHLLVNQKVIHEDKLLVMLGGYPSGIKDLLAELEDAGVFSRNPDGSIYSRRMVRDEKIRLIRRECGSKGGNPKLKPPRLKQTHLVNQKVNHGVNTEDWILNTEDWILNTEELGTSEESAASPVVTIQTNRGDEYGISAELIEEYRNCYPAVNVIQELRAMKAWSLSNPTKRKTASGMRRFMNGWLSKAQNNGNGNRAPRPVEESHEDRRARKLKEIEESIARARQS